VILCFFPYSQNMPLRKKYQVFLNYGCKLGVIGGVTRTTRLLRPAFGRRAHTQAPPTLCPTYVNDFLQAATS